TKMFAPSPGRRVLPLLLTMRDGYALVDIPAILGEIETPGGCVRMSPSDVATPLIPDSVQPAKSRKSIRYPTPRVSEGRPMLGYDYALPDSADTNPNLVIGRVHGNKRVHRNREVTVNRCTCLVQWP